MERWCHDKLQSAREETQTTLSKYAKEAGVFSFEASLLNCAAADLAQLWTDLILQLPQRDTADESFIPHKEYDDLQQQLGTLQQQVKQRDSILEEVMTVIFGPHTQRDITKEYESGIDRHRYVCKELKKLREDCFYKQHVPGVTEFSPEQFSLCDFFRVQEGRIDLEQDMYDNLFTEQAGRNWRLEFRLSEKERQYGRDKEKYLSEIKRLKEAHNHQLRRNNMELEVEKHNGSNKLREQKRLFDEEKGNLMTSYEQEISLLGSELEDRVSAVTSLKWQLEDAVRNRGRLKKSRRRHMGVQCPALPRGYSSRNLKNDETEETGSEHDTASDTSEGEDHTVHLPWSNVHSLKDLIKALEGKHSELEYARSSHTLVVKTMTMEWTTELKAVITKYEDLLAQLQSNPTVTTEEMEKKIDEIKKEYEDKLEDKQDMFEALEEKYEKHQKVQQEMESKSTVMFTELKASRQAAEEYRRYCAELEGKMSDAQHVAARTVMDYENKIRRDRLRTRLAQADAQGEAVPPRYGADRKSFDAGMLSGSGSQWNEDGTSDDHPYMLPGNRQSSGSPPSRPAQPPTLRIEVPPHQNLQPLPPTPPKSPPGGAPMGYRRLKHANSWSEGTPSTSKRNSGMFGYLGRMKSEQFLSGDVNADGSPTQRRSIADTIQYATSSAKEAKAELNSAVTSVTAQVLTIEAKKIPLDTLTIDSLSKAAERLGLPLNVSTKAAIVQVFETLVSTAIEDGTTPSPFASTLSKEEQQNEATVPEVSVSTPIMSMLEHVAKKGSKTPKPKPTGKPNYLRQTAASKGNQSSSTTTTGKTKSNTVKKAISGKTGKGQQAEDASPNQDTPASPSVDSSPSPRTTDSQKSPPAVIVDILGPSIDATRDDSAVSPPSNHQTNGTPNVNTAGSPPPHHSTGTTVNSPTTSNSGTSNINLQTPTRKHNGINTLNSTMTSPPSEAEKGGKGGSLQSTSTPNKLSSNHNTPNRRYSGSSRSDDMNVSVVSPIEPESSSPLGSTFSRPTSTNTSTEIPAMKDLNDVSPILNVTNITATISDSVATAVQQTADFVDDDDPPDEEKATLNSYVLPTDVGPISENDRFSWQHTYQSRPPSRNPPVKGTRRGGGGAILPPEQPDNFDPLDFLLSRSNPTNTATTPTAPPKATTTSEAATSPLPTTGLSATTALAAEFTAGVKDGISSSDREKVNAVLQAMHTLADVTGARIQEQLPEAMKKAGMSTGDQLATLISILEGAITKSIQCIPLPNVTTQSNSRPSNTTSTSKHNNKLNTTAPAGAAGSSGRKHAAELSGWEHDPSRPNTSSGTPRKTPRSSSQPPTAASRSSSNGVDTHCDTIWGGNSGGGSIAPFDCKRLENMFSVLKHHTTQLLQFLQMESQLQDVLDYMSMQGLDRKDPEVNELHVTTSLLIEHYLRLQYIAKFKAIKQIKKILDYIQPFNLQQRPQHGQRQVQLTSTLSFASFSDVALILQYLYLLIRPMGPKVSQPPNNINRLPQMKDLNMLLTKLLSVVNHAKQTDKPSSASGWLKAKELSLPTAIQPPNNSYNTHPYEEAQVHQQPLNWSNNQSDNIQHHNPVSHLVQLSDYRQLEQLHTLTQHWHDVTQQLGSTTTTSTFKSNTKGRPSQQQQPQQDGGVHRSSVLINDQWRHSESGGVQSVFDGGLPHIDTTKRFGSSAVASKHSMSSAARLANNHYMNKMLRYGDTFFQEPEDESGWDSDQESETSAVLQKVTKQSLMAGLNPTVPPSTRVEGSVLPCSAP